MTSRLQDFKTYDKSAIKSAESAWKIFICGWCAIYRSCWFHLFI